MNRVYKDFFELLRASLQKETAVIEENIDWSEILRLSSIHRIIPLIYESAYKTQPFQNENIQFVKYFKSASMEIIYRQMQRSDRFLQLYREFNQANIKALVFKGIILRQLYPVPEERISADEDLLIKKEDLEKAIKILESKNMERVFSDEDEADVYHYFCKKSGLHLELHTTLFGQKTSKHNEMEKIFSNVFQDADTVNINNVEVHTFSIDKHMLYIICHAIKHFVSCGTGIRQICDISMYIKKYNENINWDYIWRQLINLGYDTLLVNLLQIAIDQLGLDENKIVYIKSKDSYYIDTENLIEDIMESGIYGVSTQARLNTANMSLNALNNKSNSKIKSNLAAIFPKADTLKERYKYLEKYPLMLPIAWTNRIYTYIKERNSLIDVGATAKETIIIGNRRIDLLKEYKIIK